MKIIVAGGTGFVGQPLVDALADDHDVSVLSRNASKVRDGRGIEWDPGRPGPWQKDVADADVVVNLAGESIADGRWTEARKKAILDSRIAATTAITTAMRMSDRKGRALVNASAIGFYGSRGDEVLTEESTGGDDFLADVVRKWEAAANAASPLARLVILRFGIILGRDGGALPKMMIPFRLFAGGPTGSGRQWMSWISLEDIIEMIRWAIETPEVRGTYNATAPEPVRNREFAEALGSVMKRPSFIPAPAPALRLALGEMADALLLGSQRVIPKRAIGESFEFRDVSLGPALEGILDR